ncbi:hypothetical protein CYOC110262_24365 [Cytobacillus oceanisediminis]|uniref:Uncharacterized protein n=1 Tax=Cytobacillus oceanisediminis TaxID=665099 RepID=A0A562J5R3_9BACI|nr:hypothetical protein IQ19_05295 [Cytobacillus oceanisediminis]
MENGKLKRSGKKVSTPFCVYILFLPYMFTKLVTGKRQNTKHNTAKGEDVT